MRIVHFEITNFRKLQSIRIDVAKKTTLFVGANNSGKTSAISALRLFLTGSSKFTTNDIILCNWRSHKSCRNPLGRHRRLRRTAPRLTKIEEWSKLTPSLDIWLHAEPGEFHHVSKFIPTLDWNGGLVGVRLRLEPKDVESFYTEYLAAATNVAAMHANVATAGQPTGKHFQPLAGREHDRVFVAQTLDAFCRTHLFTGPGKGALLLQDGKARPQLLPSDATPIDGDFLSQLIRVDSNIRGATRVRRHIRSDSSAAGATVSTRRRTIVLTGSVPITRST